ncbi:hypothetical protein JA1_000789 [Spathaspora sp. JA1]|nr:hypothetical protein JA1_000789 [Spathaspora sp. JA1]
MRFTYLIALALVSSVFAAPVGLVTRADSNSPLCFKDADGKLRCLGLISPEVDAFQMLKVGKREEELDEYNQHNHHQKPQ